jgi:hypothetical protein
VTSRPERDRRAEGAAWALTLLVTLSSLAFAGAAVVGWTLDLWPATPLTLAVAAVLVTGGPLLAATLTLAIRRTPAAPARPAPVPAPAAAPRPAAPPRPPLVAATPKAARAQELLDWRSSSRRRTRA